MRQWKHVRSEPESDWSKIEERVQVELGSIVCQWRGGWSRSVPQCRTWSDEVIQPHVHHNLMPHVLHSYNFLSSPWTARLRSMRLLDRSGDIFAVLFLVHLCEAYWLMASSTASFCTWIAPVDQNKDNIITTQRLDPVVSPGGVSTHAHSGKLDAYSFYSTSLIVLVLGGSNFGLNTSTAALRTSSCTSIPIPEDKSNYWFPVRFPVLLFRRCTEILPACSKCIFSVCCSFFL
jgi:hypothetical protein